MTKNAVKKCSVKTSQLRNRVLLFLAVTVVLLVVAQNYWRVCSAPPDFSLNWVYRTEDLITLRWQSLNFLFVLRSLVATGLAVLLLSFSNKAVQSLVGIPRFVIFLGWMGILGFTFRPNLNNNLAVWCITVFILFAVYSILRLVVFVSVLLAKRVES